MEQTESSPGNPTVSRMSRYIQLASLASFVGLLAYLPFLALGSWIQNDMFLSVAIIASLYVLGIRLLYHSMISFAWAWLGVAFIGSWIVAGPWVNIVSVFIWATVLLIAYELDRLTFVTRLFLPVIGGLDDQSVKKFEAVIRNHFFDTLLICLASLAFSIVATELSEGALITAGQSILGIVVFAFVAILLIALLIRRNHL
jgi:hypothetical protein